MQGNCHCKAIKFETTATPYWIGACYCSDCQKISGSTHLIFAGFKKNQFKILQGTPKEYVSSSEVTRSFCQKCSSPVMFVYKKSPNDVFIPTGIFDNPAFLEPQEHIFVSEKPPWVKLDTK